MSIGEMVGIIIAAIGGSATLFLAITWLEKSIISHFLTKDIAVFKEKLQMESQREMAQLKSSLELIAFEHQVVFSKLHERGAEIIAMLYSKIDVQYNIVYDFIRQYPITEYSSKDQKIKNILEAVDNLRAFYNKHKIYFDVDICEIIFRFEKELSHTCSTLVTFYKDQGVIDFSDDDQSGFYPDAAAH